MKTWYEQLILPAWAPPSWVFGPVWTVLYVAIAVTFGCALWLIFKRMIPAAVVWPLVLNLLFNLIFTPIQFGLRNNWLAAVDVLLVLGTLVWLMAAIFPYARWIAWANVPYLLWVSYAAVLQWTITWLNWDR